MNLKILVLCNKKEHLLSVHMCVFIEARRIKIDLPMVSCWLATAPVTSESSGDSDEREFRGVRSFVRSRYYVKENVCEIYSVTHASAD